MNPNQPLKIRWIQFLANFGLGLKDLKKEVDKAESEIQTETRKFEEQVKSILKLNDQNYTVSLKSLFLRARRFRKQKALVKELISNICLFWFLIAVIVLPGVLIFFETSICERYAWYQLLGIWVLSAGLLFLGGWLTISIMEYVENIVGRITVLGDRIINFLLFGTVHFVAWLALDNLENWLTLTLLLTLITWLTITYSIILIYIFSDTLPDAYYYSKKVNLTDELILEATYELANKMDWGSVFRKRAQRNSALGDIERLARLLENDWSYHIKVGDETTETWKKNTLKAIAMSIRGLKREIILPSGNSAKQLKDKFNQLFASVLSHDLSAFKFDDLPAQRIKKRRGILDSIRRFIVAILPITASLIIYHEFSELLPSEYKGLPLIFSTGWLILCLLLWMDPQLGEKINILRSSKSIFFHSDDGS